MSTNFYWMPSVSDTAIVGTRAITNAERARFAEDGIHLCKRVGTGSGQVGYIMNSKGWAQFLMMMRLSRSTIPPVIWDERDVILHPDELDALMQSIDIAALNGNLTFEEGEFC